MDYLVIIVSICFLIIGFFIGWFIEKKKTKPILLNNEEIIEKNKQLQTETFNLSDNILLLNEEINNKRDILSAWEKEIFSLQNKAEKSKERYEQELNEYQENIFQEKQELESLKATKIATIEAARKEELIHKNQEDFCIRVPEEEKNDIIILENIKTKITKPRAVSMIIWSAYYQGIAKKVFPKILGTENVCGIYKITNQKTGECYIGQSVDCKKRWSEHLKAALGIDTPAGNKLYKAMQEYGIENFSFELLESCKSSELNQKEKYFINLYAADTLGYNSTKGNRINEF